MNEIVVAVQNISKAFGNETVLKDAAGTGVDVIATKNIRRI